MKIKFYIFILMAAVSGAWLLAADSPEVMPARHRAQILATAKALFDPHVKKGIRVKRIPSPFSAVQ